jgi:hypothetical protein
MKSTEKEDNSLSSSDINSVAEVFPRQFIIIQLV